MPGLLEIQVQRPFAPAIAAAPAKRYHTASEVARDHGLDQALRLRALEKRLKVETACYARERDTASPLRMREIKGVLRPVKRLRRD